MTATFGKLQGRSLELGDGLNIIEAPNETGKSTWCAFLLSILYGVNSRERDRAGFIADKNRFAPWSGAAMSGRMDCGTELGELTLTRATRRQTSPMGEFSAVYAGTNEPVPGLTGAACGETLLGISREVFERSAFIRQNNLPISQDAELERRIAALISSGEEGTSYTEALGTGAAEVAVGHIATMLVPSTNGVDLTFVGGAHIGCKSLYVLADSEYKTTEDLKGTRISTPNGIGASDYNITSLLLDADGINPQKDVELTPVETSACVTAMENGEISAALLSDTFAYKLVQDGKLRCVRSLLDADFQGEPCCIIAMNATFVKENPVISRKIVGAVQKAHSWMRENPDEATQMLIDEGLNSEDFDMNVKLNNSLQFGLSTDFTEAGLRAIAEDYIRLDLITATDDIEEVMSKAWTPVLDQ